ncbi:MAG: hypothetical protein RLZZ230_608 [Candidatus Parcubacteria bacterium]|jgi:dihydroorotate dehydrogenase
MKLRGIEFGNVLDASGVQGFFDEGYWFHKPLKAIGLLSFEGVTFVAKTVNLLGNKGNLPLNSDSSPKPWFPKCIIAKPFQGKMLNAVGLSNFGLGYYLGDGRWQDRVEPFWISIMSLASTPEKRLAEFKIMAEMLLLYKDSFSSSFGIQVNLSCPNIKHKPSQLMAEAEKILDILHLVGVPLMLKYSIASAPIPAVMELNDHPYCDAICVSNTLPFGWEGINWKKVWGSDKSPLAHLGGGGLSGRALCPLVCNYISLLREGDFTKPINGGGGIFEPRDVDKYHRAGASSIFVGSVTTLSPWQVQAIVTTANKLEWR